MSAASAGHLVHGMGVGLEAPTWPAITPDEAEAVLAQFPAVGRIVGLRWHSPRPFSAAALVQTGRGEFFLKRHHARVRSPDALAQEQRFSAHLRAAGLSVPEVVPSVEGRGAVARGAWSYEVHRKARGLDLYRDRPSWTPFLSHAHAHAAGVALARLHIAARGFDAPPRPVQPLVASFSILPAPDPLAAAEVYVAARPALAGFLADRPWQATLARLFEALGDGLAARLSGEAPLWTHNDWHASNLLWSPEGSVETAFDFGLSDRSCALHDLATAIERNAVEWLRLGEDAAIGDPGAARALLAGYATLLPLGAAALATVRQLLPLVHVEFALSEIDYFNGILAAPDHAALAWDGYLIGHAEWFHAPAGQDFLAAVFG